jgi:hypothetical protein
MNAPVPPTRAPKRGLAAIFSWPRVRFTFIATFVWAVLLSHGWQSGFGSLLFRTMFLGFLLLFVFGFFERWPRKLPRFVARWVLQVFAIGFVIPPMTAMIWVLTTPAGAPPFFEVTARMQGFGLVCGTALLFAPWIALGALVRQKDALARTQALEFDLERSQLERQASDARLRLLQSQIAPHFLFNTLANVQALVDAGSAQAPIVLRSLVAYLRAAVPRLNDPSTTIGQELDLVRAYLELMHMRMPDRLQFTVHADESTLRLACPPMTLLTLVENAVRHGIDPSEEGGRIDIAIQRLGDRVVVRVSDTGRGMAVGAETAGLGTGLSTLRERLQLAFGGDAVLRVGAQSPRGVSAEVEFPAREAAGREAAAREAATA